MPDLRFGRPSGMVVQGTRVDPLPARPRWEADAEQRNKPRCMMCDLYATHPTLRGAHDYRGVIATEHSR